MQNFLSFLYAVFTQWIALMSGTAIIVILGVIERYTLKQISWKWYVYLMILLVFYASFLAWKDENNRVSSISKELNVAIADRPWVGVYGMELVDYALGKRMGIKLRILNSGKTPGLTIITKIYIGIMEGFPLAPPEQTYPHPNRAQAVLFPNQSMDVNAILDTALSSDEFDKLASGAASLVVWGSITYTDRFERSHTSTICGAFNTKFNPTTVTFCITGNTAN